MDLITIIEESAEVVGKIAKRSMIKEMAGRIFNTLEWNDDMTINKDKSHIDSYLAESLTRDYPDLFNGNADKEEIERLQDIISDASNLTHDAEGYMYDLQNSLEEASSLLG